MLFDVMTTRDTRSHHTEWLPRSDCFWDALCGCQEEQNLEETYSASVSLAVAWNSVCVALLEACDGDDPLRTRNTTRNSDGRILESDENDDRRP